jgi:uncharacterized protein (DUF58 family)
MVDYIPFIILLMILAAFLKQDTVLVIFYFLTGVFLVGRWWSHKSLDQIQFNREFSPRVFLGQTIPVNLKITNNGWLPVVWLQIHESLPVALISPGFFQNVISLAPHETINLTYQLNANKRGYHPIGPIFLTTGDLLGASKNDEKKGDGSNVIVYPKIIPFKRLSIPSRSPLGTLKCDSPIFDDPNRIMGKRDYQVGDSFRRIDWKATAVVHRLQVKLFEPSIAITTSIFLNLDAEDYNIQQRFTSTELAIEIAASLANWTIRNRQSIGLSTNGNDPILDNLIPAPLPSRKGIHHLMSLLDVLARIQVGNHCSFPDLIHHSLATLSWGTTIILITGKSDENLFNELFGAQRQGLAVVIILVGDVPGFIQAQSNAKHFGFSLIRVRTEADLDIWQ